MNASYVSLTLIKVFSNSAFISSSQSSKFSNIGIFNCKFSRFVSTFSQSRSDFFASRVFNSKFQDFLNNVFFIEGSSATVYQNSIFQSGVNSAISINNAAAIVNIIKCTFIGYSGHSIAFFDGNTIFMNQTTFSNCEMGYYVYSDGKNIQYTHINDTQEAFNGRKTAWLCSYCGGRVDFQFHRNNNSYNHVSTYSSSFFFVFTPQGTTVASYCYGFHNKGDSLMGFDCGGANPQSHHFCFHNNTMNQAYFLLWDTQSYPKLNNFIFSQCSEVRMDSYRGGSGSITLSECIFQIPKLSSSLGNVVPLSNCEFNASERPKCFEPNKPTVYLKERLAMKKFALFILVL